MRLRLLGKDSISGDSPTLYATDRNSYVVQGWKVTDPAILAKLDPPEGETCVEVPAALFAPRNTVVADCVRVRDQLWAIAIPHGEYEPV